MDEEQVKLIIRQLEDVISQADRIIDQKPDKLEIRSFFKFSAEMASYLSTMETNNLIAERLNKISAIHGYARIRELRDIYSSILCLFQATLE